MYHRRPPRQPGPPGQIARRELSRAHRLLETGDYERAARKFERLAKGAEDRGFRKQAPFLYLKAAHARLLASQTERGVGLLSYGLKMLADTQRWQALHKAGQKAVAELNRFNHPQTAERVQAWLDEVLADHPEAKTQPDSLPALEKHPPKLPAKCPFCGASIRTDQIDWIDSNTAECLYCGSSITSDD